MCSCNCPGEQCSSEGKRERGQGKNTSEVPLMAELCRQFVRIFSKLSLPGVEKVHCFPVLVVSRA